MARRLEEKPASKPVPVPSDDYLCPDGVESEVNGKKKKFYAISIQEILRLNKVAKPLLKAFATLFQGVGQEVGGRKISKSTKQGDAEQKEEIEEADGIDPALAQVVITARDKAIEDLIDTFSEPTNAQAVARVILDSMRDDFTKEQVNNDEADRLLGADVNVFYQLLVGTAKANVGVLGPLGPRFLALVQEHRAPLGQVEAEPQLSEG